MLSSPSSSSSPSATLPPATALVAWVDRVLTAVDRSDHAYLANIPLPLGILPGEVPTERGHLLELLEPVLRQSTDLTLSPSDHQVLPGWRNPRRITIGGPDGTLNVYFDALRMECAPRGVTTFFAGPDHYVRAFMVRRSWLHYDVQVPGTLVQVGDLFVRINGKFLDLEKVL